MRKTGCLTTALMTSFGLCVADLESALTLWFCLFRRKNGTIIAHHCLLNGPYAEHLVFPLAEPQSLCYHFEVNLWHNVSQAFQLFT